MRRYFCGEEAAAAKEEEAAEAGADNGAHRLRFGDAGLSSGSKSRVLFKVAPQAMARSGQGGSERGAAVETAAAGPAQRRLPRCLEWAGAGVTAGSAIAAAIAAARALPSPSPRIGRPAPRTWDRHRVSRHCSCPATGRGRNLSRPGRGERARRAEIQLDSTGVAAAAAGAAP